MGDWYAEAAAQKGIVLAKDEARARIYGMAPSEWKKAHQKAATAEQLATLEKAQKAHP